ncbi:transglycosylase SLT domain-containing protein [Stenoxybacter acetivorans]|uniref:transglycosylase SLT domain-containing protein n=1 Tax=Stenoxybacter acetivorans TaxID=422441 RepID=UPI00069192F8|nr:transglycosylase SLT domain-containing protein [Stenoxybacter acetivorans]
MYRVAHQPVAQLVNQITHAESSGNPNAKNPRSTAMGLGQFIDSTWLNVMKQYRPDLTQGKSEQQILALRTNPQLAREMTTRHTEDNARALHQAGVAVTAGTLYLAHFAGSSKAVQLLKTADKTQSVGNILGQTAVSSNPFLKGWSVQNTIDWAHRKMKS